MNTILAWAIPIIIGILTFIAGRTFERHKIAQENRLRLLEPIENWIDKVSHLIGLVEEDITAVAQGLFQPTGYNPQDRIKTAKAINEEKSKVIGILNSNVFCIRGTKDEAKKLFSNINDLHQIIETQYLIADTKLLEDYIAGININNEVLKLIALTTNIKRIIQNIHSNLSVLKTRFN
jgi:hypothetical protein